MEKVILNATQRPKQSRRFREKGMIPGVVYGESIDTMEVKFEESELRKIIATHGTNAKVWVKYDNVEKFGFLKEIQRAPLTAQLVHVDIQVVTAGQEIKLDIPITYTGEGDLGARQLKLQVYKPEASVLGEMIKLPNVIEIDVSEKELGDSILIEDLKLDREIKVQDNIDEVYAVVTHLKKLVSDEETEEETATEAAVEE